MNDRLLNRETDNKCKCYIRLQALNSDSQLGLEPELARQSQLNMNSKNNQNEINVGVDTGKQQLDIVIRPLDIFFTVSNDEKGIQYALKEIKKHSPTRIIIEATGRLEQAFILA